MPLHQEAAASSLGRRAHLHNHRPAPHGCLGYEQVGNDRGAGTVGICARHKELAQACLAHPAGRSQASLRLVTTRCIYITAQKCMAAPGSLPGGAACFWAHPESPRTTIGSSTPRHASSVWGGVLCSAAACSSNHKVRLGKRAPMLKPSWSLVTPATPLARYCTL